MKASRVRTAAQWSLSLVLCVAPLIGARRVSCEPPQPSGHGLWIWKSPDVLGVPQGTKRLKDFCMMQGINEVYVSFSAASAPSEENDFIHLIEMMHRASIRVKRCSLAPTPTSLENIETSCLIECARSSSSIAVIRQTVSTEFTST